MVQKYIECCAHCAGDGNDDDVDVDKGGGSGGGHADNEDRKQNF